MFPSPPPPLNRSLFNMLIFVSNIIIGSNRFGIGRALGRNHLLIRSDLEYILRIFKNPGPAHWKLHFVRNHFIICNRHYDCIVSRYLTTSLSVHCYCYIIFIQLAQMIKNLNLWQKYWISSSKRSIWVLDLVFVNATVTVHQFFCTLMYHRFTSLCFYTKKGLLLGCLHHLKLDFIDNMNHMNISGEKHSLVILSHSLF